MRTIKIDDLLRFLFFCVREREKSASVCACALTGVEARCAYNNIITQKEEKGKGLASECVASFLTTSINIIIMYFRKLYLTSHGRNFNLIFSHDQRML